MASIDNGATADDSMYVFSSEPGSREDNSVGVVSVDMDSDERLVTELAAKISVVCFSVVKVSALGLEDRLSRYTVESIISGDCEEDFGLKT